MAVELLNDEETQSLIDGRVSELVAHSHPIKTTSLLRPATTVAPVRIRWRYAIGIPLIHLLACLAFVPWLFSWTGVACALFGLYVFGTLGINLCYHRMLTHQGFVMPKWLEHSLAILGVCNLQDTPACWIAMHRLHHQHADEQPDPHSPLVNFLWGHCGWLMVQNRDFANLNFYQRYTRDILRDPFYMKLERNGVWVWIYMASVLGHCGWLMVQNRDFANLNFYQRYTRDILRDPFYMKLERNGVWVWIYMASVLFFYLAGLAIGWATTGSAAAGAQFGLSLVVWGVFVRTVLMWHLTWSVNSVTHIWGYQNYETGDSSRNNLLIGLLANGEGWHNNHHAEQRSAAHGHKWWEFDLTWLTIYLLEKLGLATQVVRPREWAKKLHSI